jgi:hypothetical protein
MARRLMGTKRFLKLRDERKRVEMRFAHLKTHHGFDREEKFSRNQCPLKGPVAHRTPFGSRYVDKAFGRIGFLLLLWVKVPSKGHSDLEPISMIAHQRYSLRFELRAPI